MDDGFVIRPMSRAELDTVVEWAAAEGWNPGDHDADAFYATDPGGFYAGVLNGELIGSISAVRYGQEFTFMGYFIVTPEHRGRGYGLRLWMHAIERLNTVSTGLDGVPAQTANYARSGFEHAYQTTRNEGSAQAAGATDGRIGAYKPSDFADVVRYDEGMFPLSRPVFLEHWLQQPGSQTLVLRDHAGLAGFGTIRQARQGYRIGPLFADHFAGACVLYDALVASVPAGSRVFLDVPQANLDALDLVKQRGMSPSFETSRMYRGRVPGLDISRVYGVTSLELG
jgi:GNAT superfamily N-acetyltransferase